MIRTKNDRLKVQAAECGPTRTKQAFKDKCDVNQVVKRFTKTGLVDHVNQMKAEYGDYSDFVDYRDCVSKVFEAEAMFMELPSKVRKRFQNDPQEFFDFMMDEANFDEALEMGLIREERPPVEEDKKASKKEAKAAEAAT